MDGQLPNFINTVTSKDQQSLLLEVTPTEYLEGTQAQAGILPFTDNTFKTQLHSFTLLIKMNSILYRTLRIQYIIILVLVQHLE